MQARIKPDGSGSGVADCVRRYVRNNSVTTTHGVVSITAARVIPTAAGFTVSFDGSRIVITDDNGLVTVVDDLWDRAAFGGVSLHVGTYQGGGPGETAVGAFHTLQGGALGAGGDHFINGVLTLTGVV